MARRTRAVLEVDPVIDEMERRASVGLAPILKLSLLEALRTLPADVAVPVEDLNVSLRSALPRAPAGCLEMDAGRVVRKAVPPVRVLSAGVCASTWSDGLRQASRFASYCARYAVMTSSRFDVERATMEARFYGIGLATMLDGPQSFGWLLEPAPFQPARETSASWHFAETAFEAVGRSTQMLFSGEAGVL